MITIDCGDARRVTDPPMGCEVFNTQTSMSRFCSTVSRQPSNKHLLLRPANTFRAVNCFSTVSCTAFSNNSVKACSLLCFSPVWVRIPFIKDRKSSSFFPPSFKAEAKDRIEEEEEEEVEREDDEDEELLLDEELKLELEREEDEDEELLLDEELLPID